MNNIKHSIKGGILILEFKCKVDLDLVRQYKELFENSTNKTYPIVLYKNVIGYYSAYDFEKDCSIYCGTMSEKTSLKQIQDYKNESIY